MLNLITYYLIINFVHVLTTNVSFVPDDRGHFQLTNIYHSYFLKNQAILFFNVFLIYNLR